MLKKLIPQNDSEVKTNQDLYSTLVSKLDALRLQEQSFECTFNNMHKNHQKGISKNLETVDKISLFSIQVKLLCKSCNNFRLIHENYLNRCGCGNEAYLCVDITNLGAPVKVNIDVSIANLKTAKLEEIFHFARDMKKDEITQNYWQFKRLESNKQGARIQLDTRRRVYNDIFGHYEKKYDSVYGGDYFSSIGNLTLKCKIELQTFPARPPLVSLESQYPGTFTILANMFSDDNINPDGPLVDKFTDMILLVGGNKIHCHKLVLRMTSGFFKRMFASNMKESQSHEIILKEVDLETIKSMLSFMYQDKIEDEKINTDLLAAADMYEVLRLRNICSVKLAQIINMENVARIWHSAYLHNEEDLAQLSMIYMAKRWKTLSNQSEICELCSKYPDLLYTISTLMGELLSDNSK